MIGTLRRRRRSRLHPTPQQALEALREGACMYAGISSCAGPAGSVGLRDNEDINNILTCKAHLGRLRRLDQRSVARLERVLVREFANRVTA